MAANAVVLQGSLPQARLEAYERYLRAQQAMHKKLRQIASSPIEVRGATPEEYYAIRSRSRGSRVYEKSEAAEMRVRLLCGSEVYRQVDEFEKYIAAALANALGGAEEYDGRLVDFNDPDWDGHLHLLIDAMRREQIAERGPSASSAASTSPDAAPGGHTPTPTKPAGDPNASLG